MTVPPAVAARLNTALEHQEHKRIADAELTYKALIQDYPTNAAIYWYYGNMLHFSGRIKDAALLYHDCVLAGEGTAEIKGNALCNLGHLMQGWGKLDQAKGCWEYALKLDPKNSVALNNMGVMARWDRDMAKAQEYQSKALTISPNSAEAHFECAFIALTCGDLRRGFAEYEWRWKWEGFKQRRFMSHKPRWNGQKANGKTVLIWHEQGHGDSIQFIRYAKMAKAKSGATIRVLCPPELVELLKTVEGVDDVTCVYVEGYNDEGFDFHVPMLSLPRIFKTSLETIPADIPYILGGQPSPPSTVSAAPSDRQTINTSVTHMESPGAGVRQPNHGSAKLLRVGFVWAGRKEHAGDRWRSVEVDMFKPLFELPGIEWRSLQFGERAGEADKYLHVKHLGKTFKDFTCTVKALADLDLLISVDTSVIHLAGAMGVPVWALIPYSPDWRWMLSGDKSPWYPSMTLFRQDSRGDWAGVFERVRKELCTFALNHS
jgi:Tfp pilus assembly protein PilF